MLTPQLNSQAAPARLSVLLPTHRTSLAAISRIAQVCSWASPDIEVIVRDNSGDAAKRDLISRFQGNHCQVVTADPCEPLENFSELLRLAKGDFIFCPADDDFSFDRAIEAAAGLIKQFGNDPSVAGIAGQVVIEASNGSAIVSYPDIDSDDVVARISGYISFGGPNVFLYSVIRRETFQGVMSFMNSMPIFLSFHDQIQSLLFLLSGKFIQLPRLLYAYDIGVWEARETSQQRDIAYFTAAGLDPAINVLQWLLCAFEGAVLMRNARIFPDYPMAQRQVMADRWFSARFAAFVRDKRSTFGSQYGDEAERIRAKLLMSTGQLTFQHLLIEICNTIALFSNDKAKRYYEFWDAQINQSANPRAQAPGLTAASVA